MLTMDGSPKRVGIAVDVCGAILLKGIRVRVRVRVAMLSVHRIDRVQEIPVYRKAENQSDPGQT